MLNLFLDFICLMQVSLGNKKSFGKHSGFEPFTKNF